MAAFAGRVAGMRQPPRGLLQLANMLRAQAARSGCYQSPQPFHPHITLLRDAGHAVPIPTGLWLVISGHGVRTLLLFIRTRTHALYAAATLDAD
jgi:2'-5' RNA ligase